MPCDSFGHQVMTLNEVIAALTFFRDKMPDAGSRPVWLYNVPPLRLPVERVHVDQKGWISLDVRRG